VIKYVNISAEKVPLENSISIWLKEERETEVIEKQIKIIKDTV
jgi:hypothetical protein